MSAFAVIYERTETPGEFNCFNKVMERLKHRGPDGNDVFFADNIAMGHWHFYTTPEEIGERQPLAIESYPFRIVLDGRIDNREELFLLLDITLSDGKKLSDAALILYAYAHWGEECFKHFVGEFAVVIYDEQHQEVICACDHLGDRILFYSFQGPQLVIASEPWAVAAAILPKSQLNESAIAHYFALLVPEDGQTFFNDVYELLPAHILKVSKNHQTIWRYWQPDPNTRIRYNSDKEYGEHFLTLLDESIRCRMRSSLPTGVLMSGGLDSTPVACLAARKLASDKLTTLSYVFDKFPECDERQYINAVKERWQVNSIQFSGDDSWTFNDWESWPYNPNHPDRNFYRLLLENTYKIARDNGIQVILAGYMGDHLYFAGSDWIADLIADGLLKNAIKELVFQIKEMGWKETVKTGHLRRIARRIVDRIKPGALRLPRHKSVPIWLNSEYAHLITKQQTTNPVFERYGALLSLASSRDINYGIYYSSHYGLEFRNPYRDRRLIEFILAIPAYQLYYQGIHKYIIRTAMQNILPEIVQNRTERTTFESLYHYGIEREKQLFESFLKNKGAKWQNYFAADWNSKMLELAHLDSIVGLLPFACIAFEVWYHQFYSYN